MFTKGIKKKIHYDMMKMDANKVNRVENLAHRKQNL